ncbi:endocuticle structural glycoprotein SgAbd-2-like [Arctopsyche grandis]|uniref:endocuticle structural glycoprotein SgAbd-2-like n=1 Tax=Arctopsyche grandis TaxID=121162 RepID=UPI00406D63C8
MYTTVVFAALVALASSAPQYGHQQQQHSGQIIPIVRQSQDVNHDGSYQYSYETGNGIQAQEQGYLKNAGIKDQEAQVAQGSYSYTGPDGIPITVTYIADENGFRAEGAHLPTPPPIPEAIQKALLLIQSQPAQPAYNQNQYNQNRRF